MFTDSQYVCSWGIQASRLVRVRNNKSKTLYDVEYTALRPRLVLRTRILGYASLVFPYSARHWPNPVRVIPEQTAKSTSSCPVSQHLMSLSWFVLLCENAFSPSHDSHKVIETAVRDEREFYLNLALSVGVLAAIRTQVQLHEPNTISVMSSVVTSVSAYLFPTTMVV